MPFTIPNEADAGFADQAEVHARDLDVLTLAYGGTGVLSGCVVTAQGVPDLTVAVAAGSVVSGNHAVAVAAGNVTMTTADATNPRFDLVYATSGGVKTWLAGTASTNPTPPAIPAGGVALAFVYVPALDNIVNATQIVDKRVIISDRGSVYIGVAAVDSHPLVKAVAHYTCTGTADETTINAALAEAGTNATVLVAAGSYATTGAISLATNQSIILHPRAVVTRSGAGNAVEVVGTSGVRKTGVTIQGGRFIGPSTSAVQVIGSGVKVEFADRISVRNVFVQGFGSGGNEAGVELQSCTEVEVSGCELTANKNGICSGQPAALTVVVERCRLINNIAYSNYDDGVHGQRSRYMSYVGNICYGHPGGGAVDGSGIDLLGDEYDTVTGNICFNNARGIEVGHTGPTNVMPDVGHTVSGNTCAFNTSYGVTIVGRVKDCTFSGNAVTSNTTDGFRVGTATATINIEDIVVSNNAVHDNGTSGIDVFGYCTGVDVRGNHLSGHTTADIRVRLSTGAPTDCTVEHNRCRSTTKILRSGDVNTIVKDNRGEVGGMEITLGPFHLNDIPGTATTHMKLGFYNTVTLVSLGSFDVVMTRAGRVVGAVLILDAATTAGTATVQVRIAGVATAFLAGAVATSTAVGFTTSDSAFDELGLAFAANQAIGMALVTAAFTPITADATGFLIVRLD